MKQQNFNQRGVNRENVIKPEAIFAHTNLISEVNLSYQYLVVYSFFKKGYEMSEEALYFLYEDNFVEQLCCVIQINITIR